MGRRVFFYSVVSGLVTSVLFVWLLEPVSHWIWNSATSSASVALTDMQSKAFENAALGKRDWVSALTFLMGTSALISLLAGVTTASWLLVPLRPHLAKVLGNKKRRRRIRLLTRTLFTVVVLWVSFTLAKMYFFVYVDLQLNASFSQRMDALGPYMDVAEERRLKSQWALMRSREDYERINSQLSALALKEKINLPTPLYE